MRIQVIFTGGTIGGDLRFHSTLDSGLRARAFRNHLREAIQGEPLLRSIDLLEIVTPLNVFSEQMSPNDWSTIARSVYDIVGSSDPPDGVVILHGTDTLSFSAAALSFMLLGVSIPVIVTGSTLPLMAVDTDAKRNFLDSLRVAGDPRFRGVFVVYSGAPDRPSAIHAGTRARKQSFPIPATFFSVNAEPIGRIREGSGPLPSVEIENHALLARVQRANSRHLLAQPALRSFEKSSIAYYQIYPGFAPAQLERAIDDSVGGVVLDLYNSGTACTDGPYSLIKPLQRARENRIPVFATSQHLGPTEMATYGSSVALREAGVVPLREMSHEAALAKLLWVRSRLPEREHYDEVVSAMAADLCGEMDVSAPLGDTESLGSAAAFL